MNKSAPLTIEIFRDADTPAVDLSAIEKGLEIVQGIVPALAIGGLERSRAIRLTLPDQDFIDSEKIRWPRFKADLNLVATNRPIWQPGTKSRVEHVSDDLKEVKDVMRSMEAKSSPTVGVTHKRDKTLGGVAVSIVDVKKATFPQLVTSHEIGHMLGLKEVGETYDGDAHCTLEDCLMFEEGTTDVGVVILSPQNVVEKWRRRLGLCVSNFETVITPRAEKFCAECSEQMGRYAYLLSLTKQGISIPPSLMWGNAV